MELNISGSFLIDAAVGWTVLDPDEFGGRIIGIKQAWGVGWSPVGDVANIGLIITDAYINGFTYEHFGDLVFGIIGFVPAVSSSGSQ
jgi:hypothetical protein